MSRALARLTCGFSNVAVAAALLFGCCGAATPAAPPEPEPVKTSAPDEVEQPRVDETPPAAPSESEPAASEQPKPEPAGDEPKFTDGMSVNDAINAVPRGVSRVNVDAETLGKPLADGELYAPCKLPPTQ